ncbi:MAG: Gfo/Idh/MocA family oxidoreductase [Sedimentisphaerales bacterium]|jgi:predicted dehydrogenase
MALKYEQIRQSRREFLKTATAALGAGVASQSIWFPALVRASSGDQVRLAGVGCGGKGASDIRETSKGQIMVALCDVDQNRAASTRKQFPNAKFYTDWRKMLEKEAKNIDGITVSTPDHMHAPVTMTAISMGLATYTQKPLTRTVYEARQLRLAARRAGVATQMGNQGHSGVGYRMVVDLIQRGVIGKVKEAHTWSNRPIWPQGLDRPAGSDPIPDTLDWDKWLGVAPERPFKAKWPESSGYKGNRDVYVPFSWRGWYDFGAGALGDMGCHIIDPVYWSLELTAPNWVAYNGPAPKPEMFPTEETLTYEFPGTRYTDGTINVKWYDGGRKPPRELAQMGVQETGKNKGKPRELPTNGSLFIGTKGVLMCPHGGGPQLFPKENFRGLDRPNLKGMDHYMIWTNAIKGDRKTNCSFAYAGRLAETVLLGVIASRVPGQRLLWDSEGLRFTNSDKANGFVREDYRAGWEVKGLS